MRKYAREDTHFLLYISDELRVLLLRASGQRNLLEDVLGRSAELCKQAYQKPVFSLAAAEEQLLKYVYSPILSQKVYRTQRHAAPRVPGAQLLARPRRPRRRRVHAVRAALHLPREARARRSPRHRRPPAAPPPHPAPRPRQRSPARRRRPCCRRVRGRNRRPARRRRRRHSPEDTCDRRNAGRNHRCGDEDDARGSGDAGGAERADAAGGRRRRAVAPGVSP